jgi:gluconolactonase
MAVDTVGNLWVAAGLNAPRPGGETMDTKAGIYVFAPDGRQLRMIPIPEDLVTNVAFGGPQRRTAFIVAGKTLYRARSEIDGTRR